MLVVPRAQVTVSCSLLKYICIDRQRLYFSSACRCQVEELVKKLFQILLLLLLTLSSKTTFFERAISHVEQTEDAANFGLWAHVRRTMLCFCDRCECIGESGHTSFAHDVRCQKYTVLPCSLVHISRSRRCANIAIVPSLKWSIVSGVELKISVIRKWKQKNASFSFACSGMRLCLKVVVCVHNNNLVQHYVCCLLPSCFLAANDQPVCVLVSLTSI